MPRLIRFDAARRAIGQLKRLDWPKFDPFRVCNVAPRERHVRDFIFALLDTSQRQEIATDLLHILFDMAADRAPRAAIVRSAWAGKPFEVRREWKWDNVQPDVVVFGDNFMLAIEIKRRLGVETKVGGKSQTRRLLAGLQQRARKRRIEQKNTLAIMLSPAGTKPDEPKVVPISSDALFSKLAERVNIAHSNERLICPFLDFLTRD
jgi:hypothetical protein